MRGTTSWLPRRIARIRGWGKACSGYAPGGRLVREGARRLPAEAERRQGDGLGLFRRVIRGEGDGFNFHQQIASANIRGQVDRGHLGQTSFHHLAAGLVVARMFEVDAKLGDVAKRGARAGKAEAGEILGGDEAFDVVDGLLGLPHRVTDVDRFRIDDAGRAGDEERDETTLNHRHGPGEFRRLGGVDGLVIVRGCLAGIFQRKNEDVAALGVEGDAGEVDMVALGANAGAGGIDDSGGARGAETGAKVDVAVEVRTGAVELLVTLRAIDGGRDLIHVNPGARDVVETDSGFGEGVFQVLERGDGFPVGIGGWDIGPDTSGVDPSNAVRFDGHDLGAEAFDVNVRSAEGPKLDAEGCATTRRLNDDGCHGWRVTEMGANHFAANLFVAAVLQEHHQGGGDQGDSLAVEDTMNLGEQFVSLFPKCPATCGHGHDGEARQAAEFENGVPFGTELQLTGKSARRGEPTRRRQGQATGWMGGFHE
jgi:hypothetical protein